MYKRIVALYGVPRSGTSWLGQILDSSSNTAYRFQPLFSYQFKNRIKVEDTKEEIEKFFSDLYNEKNNEFLNQTKEREEGICPKFKKNNSESDILVYKEVRYLYTIPLLLDKMPNIKIIGIVRNPYDVLESWINAPSEFKKEWNIEEEWYFGQNKNEYKPENYYGYSKWKECMKMFKEMQKKYPKKFFLIQYEKLYKNAEKTVREIFDFCEIPFDKQTVDFIYESQNKTVANAYGVYRKKDGGKLGKRKLPNKIKEMIYRDLQYFEEAKELGY